MIRFKDFAPQMDSANLGFWESIAAAFNPQEIKTSPPTIDSLTAELNAWVEETSAQVINIETVVVPTTIPSTEQTILRSESVQIAGIQNFIAFQFLRVWYREKP